MHRRLTAVLLCSACYQPTIATGVPCSDTRDCPLGQVCAANDRCELPGQDGAVDVPSDATNGWSPPQLLVELSSPSVDTDPTLSADGLEIVFTSSRPGGSGLSDLYRASRASRTEPFGPPVLIAELSTIGNDNATDLTADGMTLYIRRAVLTPDIFVARRFTRSSPFDLPMLVPDLSSPAAETNPAISRDGRTFSVTREVGLDRELYVHELSDTGMWGPARQLTELSTPGIESGAAFGQTGLVMVFHSDRAAAPDVADLYIATRASTTAMFGTPVPITELNTPAGNESDATVTADLRLIIYECAQDLCYSTR